MFYQIPYGDNSSDDNAVILFRVMTGITFGLVLSGFIVIPSREAMKPLIYNLHNRAMEMPSRLRRVITEPHGRSSRRIFASYQFQGSQTCMSGLRRFLDAGNNEAL